MFLTDSEGTWKPFGDSHVPKQRLGTYQQAAWHLDVSLQLIHDRGLLFSSMT